ncbi:MAG TPA: 4-(cytidine 5'-diphospho)-2-C-methyl-D-erythritol kinase [Bryobacteraceae bacterium]|nr:4-(cytidine 5'-diphospho)-2-C-methyl-D-erythritol kinase [Bryobacteraceae bacterium]
MTSRTARVPAYAKLNLGLRILYKRPDGYHELRTVFQTISLADRLEIIYKPARVTKIAVNGTPEIPDNLVQQACRRILEALKIHGDVAFNLKKNIPMGAGLGGGSSDAAAVLLALPPLAGKYLSFEQLTAIAGELGSDVPFFLHGGAALGLGRGEELYPLPDRRGVQGLLVVPKVHSSTAEAYRDLSATLTSIALQNKLVTFQQEVWQGAANGDAAGVEENENDFEAVVFARHPELQRIKQRLIRFGAKPAAMTGSGSGIFGVFRDAASVSRVQDSFADARVFRFSFLSRAQYRSAWRRALHLHAEGTQWPPRNPSVRNQYAR